MFYDLTTLVPLSLDRVLGNEGITSSLPIFQLPIELVSHIIPYLSTVNIQNLAYVDRDTRQLARALQFTHVELDYSRRSLELLAKLKDEEVNHTSYRLGTCIRRLTVRIARPCFNIREGLVLEELQELSLQDRLQRIGTAKQTEAAYLRDICDLLPHLPNLHILDWQDEAPLTPDLMGPIMSSSIAHLRLDGPVLNTEFTLSPPVGRNDWPLESLSINVGWSLTTPNPGDITPFTSSLLRLTAPTLRHLTWSGYTDRLSLTNHSYDMDIHFPVLRDVTLDHIKLKDASILGRMLGNHVRVRSLSIDSSLVVSQFLARHGHIPSLTRLRWDRSVASSHDDLVEFVQNNPQLSCFEVTSPLSYITINSILNHQNHLHFDHLIALHLVFEGHDPTEEVLTTIALITSLQHLWLSAGIQHGMRYEWAINHESMAEILRPLSRLETIAFTRDTYRVNGHPLLDTSIERYYMNKVLPQDLLLNDYLTEDELTKANRPTAPFEHALRLRDSLRFITWERWHLSQMVTFATGYSEVLRNLKWCFMGQVPMCIEDNMFCRIAEPVIEGRDPGMKSLYVHWDHVTGNL